MAFPFLWISKPEALKRKSLLNTFTDGGLNIVDIRTKIESLFVKKVLQLIKSITPGGPSQQAGYTHQRASSAVPPLPTLNVMVLVHVRVI